MRDVEDVDAVVGMGYRHEYVRGVPVVVKVGLRGEEKNTAVS